MNTIAVLGTGYVGLVSGTCFAEIGNRVICCDVNADKIERLNRKEVPFYEPGLKEMIDRNAAEGRLSFTVDLEHSLRQADIVYIAVGTPMAETGEADLSYVYEAARMIGAHLDRYKIVVVKSTVPVGTARQVMAIIGGARTDVSIPFDVVSNPEFLREGSAVADCMNMERAIVGAASAQAGDRIAELHAPFRTTVLRTDLESAEMIKYASNAFLATKITFINEIANLCERVGGDIEQVAKGMGMDSRIGGKFLRAGIGYGGSCFPKDTEALRFMAQRAGYPFRTLDAVVEVNDRQRLIVIDKLEEMLGGLEGTRIAVLGLTFKPETDDIRCAPALTVIPELKRRGATVHAYDPLACESTARLLGHDNTAYFEDVYEAVRHCDACLVLTEWQTVAGMDVAIVRRLMNRAVMADGRNCFDPAEMARHGFAYASIGRRNADAEARAEAQTVTA